MTGELTSHCWCLKICFWCVNRLKKMSSSDSELNMTEAVRLVTELNSELLLEKSKERYIGQFNILTVVWDKVN
jgi:hypothetical protein